MDVTAALAVDAHTPFALQTVQLDEPRADEVRVRVHGVGICHTDLVMKSGITAFPFPAVLGHEGAGVVEAIGSAVSEFRVGDHVVMSFLSCGECRHCSADAPAYCQNLMTLNYSGGRADGSATLHHAGRPLGSHFFAQSSFATHALAHERNLVRVPEDLPLDILGPLGCGIQTGAGAVMRSLDLGPESSLLIAGAGAVGLSAVMAAKLRGCRHVVVLEPTASRRALALELGATCALDPQATQDIAGEILAIEPRGLDAALDTSGDPRALEACLASLAVRGVLGLVGSAAADTPVPGHVNGLMSRGQSIRGIIEGDSDPKRFIPELLAHYRAGDFPFDKLVSKYAFADINRAVEDLASGIAIKAVLVMA